MKPQVCLLVVQYDVGFEMYREGLPYPVYFIESERSASWVFGRCRRLHKMYHGPILKQLVKSKYLHNDFHLISPPNEHFLPSDMDRDIEHLMYICDEH